MGTYRLGVFPSLHNKLFQDDVAFSIVNFFLQHFPTNYFNTIFVDTQTGNANPYVINTDGEMVKVKSGQKLIPPYVRFNIKQGRNNINDTVGGYSSLNQQPGAFGIDTRLTGYKPFLMDPFGIILATNDLYIRNTIEIMMVVSSKGDQLSLLNVLDSNIKKMYGYTVESKSNLILPSILMEYIRSCIFKPEIKIIDRTKFQTENDKIAEMKKLNSEFMKYLFEYSGNGIRPYKIPNENKPEVVFTLDRTQRVYLKLEDSEPDDGVKKGNIYDQFNITLSGFFDYANPISFITSVPAIIRGTKNNFYMTTSSNKSKQNYYSTVKFKEVYHEERNFTSYLERKFHHFYLERELMMCSRVEKFNILNDIIEKDKCPIHYMVVEYALSMLESKKEFDELFKVVIYKNKESIDNFLIDEKFNIEINDCDLSVPYYIDVFINKEKMLNMVHNKNYRDNNAYFKQSEADDLSRVKELFTNITNEYSSNRISGLTVEEYKKVNFTPNLNNTYYVRTSDKIFIPVKGLVSWKNGSKLYIKIENQFFLTNLMPDPDTIYYIRDSEGNYVADAGINKWKTGVVHYTLSESLKYVQVEHTVLDLMNDYYIKSQDDIFRKIDLNKTLYWENNVDHFIRTEDGEYRLYDDSINDLMPDMIYYVKDSNDNYISVSEIVEVEEYYYTKRLDDKYELSSIIDPEPNVEYYTKNDKNEFIYVGRINSFDRDKKYYSKIFRIIHGFDSEQVIDPDNEVELVLDGETVKKSEIINAINSQFGYGVIIYQGN